jgi:hypothetical protein
MKDPAGFQSLLKLLLLYNDKTQRKDPRAGIKQLFAPQPRTRSRYIPITTTILAAIVACWVAPSKAPGPTGIFFTEDKSPAAKDRTKKITATLYDLENKYYVDHPETSPSLRWNSANELKGHPVPLWNILFPGIADRLDDRVLFRYSGVSNGVSFNAWINDTSKPTTSSQPNANPDLKFGYGDWRSHTLPNPESEEQAPASLHDIAGLRDTTLGDGLKSIKGHKGIHS